MSVGLICVREVDTANPNETVAVAAERMHQRVVGSLVEFTQIGRLLIRETPRAVIENSVRAGIARLESEERLSVGD